MDWILKLSNTQYQSGLQNPYRFTETQYLFDLDFFLYILSYEVYDSISQNAHI